MKALVISLLLLSGLLLIPQAQATTTEKFPSETAIIIAGWDNPTNAYAHDDIYASSSLSGADEAEQSYYGFGFNFNGTETIERVYLKTYFHGWFSDYNFAFNSWEIRFRRSYLMEIFGGVLLWDTSGTGYITDGWINPYDTAFDITELANDHVGNSTIYEYLNSLRVSAYFSCYVTDGASISLDFISIEVSYSEGGGFTRGFLFGGVLCGLIAIVAVLLIERKD